MPDSTPSLREVLGDRHVRTLTTAQVCLSIGVFLQAAILAKQVYDITGDEFDLGLLGLVEFLPAFLLVLVTGSVADRFNRRRIALLGIAGEMVCTAGFFLYTRSKPTAVLPLFLIVIAFGAFRAFIAPATRSMPPMVAPEGALPRVIAINSAIFTLAFIAGPGASGFLYAADPAWGYAVALVLQGIGFLSMLRVRFRREPPPVDPDERPSLTSALAGLRLIRRTPVLFAAISLDLFAVLFGGAVALLPAIAEDRLGVGDVAYGWLRAAIGIGAGATALLMAIRPVQRHIGRVLLIAVGVFGVFTIVLGLTRNYAVAFISIALLSGADMVSVFIRSTLVPLVTPDGTRGRVLAVESVFIGASNELGAFESGVAAKVGGTQFAVVSGGIATLAVVVFYWIVFMPLRVIDRFSDLEPDGGDEKKEALA